MTPESKQGGSRLVLVLEAIERAGILGATEADIEFKTGIWRPTDLLSLLDQINRWDLIRIVTGDYCRRYYLTNLGKEYLDKRRNEKKW